MSLLWPGPPWIVSTSTYIVTGFVVTWRAIVAEDPECGMSMYQCVRDNPTFLPTSLPSPCHYY